VLVAAAPVAASQRTLPPASGGAISSGSRRHGRGSSGGQQTAAQAAAASALAIALTPSTAIARPGHGASDSGDASPAAPSSDLPQTPTGADEDEDELCRAVIASGSATSAKGKKGKRK
jgi:hypothetical protein